MLREPHRHEWKILKDIKILPFVLSRVEGLRGVFQQSARDVQPVYVWDPLIDLGEE
ncbi:MAG TPA: hypothetical protein VGK57_16385 [Candidatus Binatia bacterium]